MPDMYDDVIPATVATPAPAGTETSPDAGSNVPAPAAANGQAGLPQPSQSTVSAAVTDADFASLADEAQEVDPDASVADAPPPVPLGYYPVKLKLRQDHPLLVGLPGVAKKNDDGKSIKSIRCDIDPTICEEGGEFDKRYLDRIFASTGVFNNTSWADDIVKAKNGGKLPYGTNRDHRTAWKAMATVLKSEPVVGAEIDWKLAPDGKNEEGGYDKDFIRSAHSGSWPKNADGTPVMLDADPVTKKPARTRAYVKRVFPLNQLPELRAARAGGRIAGTGTGTGTGGTGTSSPTTSAVPMID